MMRRLVVMMIGENGSVDREATRRLAGSLGITAAFDRKPTSESPGR